MVILWLLSYATSFLSFLSFMPNATEVAFQSAFVAPHLKSKSFEKKKIKNQHISFGLSVCLGGGLGRVLAFGLHLGKVVSKMTFQFSLVKVFQRSYNQSMPPATLHK